MDAAVAQQRVVARSVFEVGGVEYSWGDVVAAARLRGDWASFERAARHGLVALYQLHALGRKIDPAKFERAAAEWRYERNLLSGDELETWLAHWDLGVSEWSDWIGQALARDCSVELGPSESTVPDEDDVEIAVGVEAICSGALHRWARELAGRAAVAAARSLYAASAPDPEPPPARGVLALEPRQWWASVAKVASFDVALDQLLATEIDDADVEREIARHRADWLTFDCWYLRFFNEGMAREAVFCIRDDARSAEDVASAARVPVERRRFVLEDLRPELQSELLGASVGELVGPVEDRGAYVVLHVAAKQQPAITDAAVADRARERAWERVVRREVATRIRWHERS